MVLYIHMYVLYILSIPSGLHAPVASVLVLTFLA